MIRLLLCLSVLWLSTDAALVGYSGSTTLDLSSCHITYFGQEYDKLYIDFTDAGTFACFDEFQSEGAQDCIKLPAVVSKTFKAEVGIDSTGLDENNQPALPNIIGPSTCGVQLEFQFSGQDPSDIYFINYGTQAVVYWTASLDPGSSDTFEILAPGVTAATISETVYFGDLTGCRQDGSVHLKDEEIPVPDTCITKTCQATGEWRPETSKCTSTQSCLGNNICGTEQFCSVIGPTYIDFFESAGFISDFCSYTLLSVTGLTVTGYFNDRRLTDVPFLSKVVLRTTADIYLSEGGTVSTDGTELTLSSTPETHHEVDLSKDDSGVTAEFKDNDITTTVFYDGTILHITHTVPEGETSTPTGACGGAADGTYKDDANSPDDCATVTPDPEGDVIDCPTITSECYHLEIDSCEVNPDPYREACKNLFCNYPKVDGLKCDIMHAYAKTCKLQDWTDPLCPAPVCLDHKCGENEFCVVNLGGEPACFCRGRFSSKYKSSGFYGDPTVCEDKSASITLYTCFLEELSINYSGLSLIDANCKGKEDPDTKTLTFSFSDSEPCGAILTAEKDQIVLKNHITNRPSSITRENQTTLTFSCTYTQPGVESLTLKIAQHSIIQVFDSVDIPFTLLMSAFSDAGLTQAVTSNLDLNQKVWVTLEAQGVDTVKLALVIDRCWATSDPSPTATNKYDLIINECANPSDDTVEVVSNGETEVTTFSYNVFQFVGSAGDVYLHCQVHLCIKDDGCVPDCTHPARRRRSLAGYKSENPALITMAWTN